LTLLLKPFIVVFMNEMSHPEKPQEILDIQINNQIFDRFDYIAEHLPEEEDRKFLSEIISLARKSSFEYLEETLNFILSDKKEEVGDKEISHKIKNILSGLKQALDEVNVPSLLLENEQEKAYRDFKKVALDYSLNNTLNYEKEVLKNKRDASEVLKEMKLDGVMDSKYIEEVLINKINALPVDIKDNLILPKETILAEKAQ